jgi:Protein of unknown function (DUF3532).
LTPWPRAASVAVDQARLRVLLKDGREISVPFDWFDFLGNATDAQRQDYRMDADGEGIHWDQLEDSISVPSLFGLPEDRPPDPSVRRYVVDYRIDGEFWVAEVRGWDRVEFGRSLSTAKRRVRQLLRAWLQVRNLEAAGIEVVDAVHSAEAVGAR